MATSLLAFHLPAYFFQKWLMVKYEEWIAAREEAALIHGSGLASEIGYSSVSSNEDALMSNVSSPTEEKPRTIFGFSSFLPKAHHKIIKAALIISPLWFGANCFYNYSLLLTSVSSSTIISNLSASFTLAFSWYMGLEEASAVKIIGIAICFIGAVSVGLQDEESGGSDDDSSKGSLGGDIMAIAGSIGYGLYTTVMRWKVSSEQERVWEASSTVSLWIIS
jgi:drug/metabolite transporter (DMT)-like permease